MSDATSICDFCAQTWAEDEVETCQSCGATMCPPCADEHAITGCDADKSPKSEGT